jgi:hypothetical protein
LSLTRAVTETHDHCQFRWLRNNDFVADHWRWQVKLVFSSATCLLAGWLAGCPCFLLEHCCFSQCYDHGYWVPFTTMKFWRNLLLSDCSRTWACCCKPSVNHVNLAPPLRKSCNQVVRALWLWQSLKTCIYIHLLVWTPCIMHRCVISTMFGWCFWFSKKNFSFQTTVGPPPRRPGPSHFPLRFFNPSSPPGRSFAFPTSVL